MFKMKRILRMKKCPDCKNEKIEQHTEGKICGICGLVIDRGYFSGRMLLI